MPSKRSYDRPLTVVVLDVSPVVWGERDIERTASDKARLAAQKRSVGPAILEECLSAVQAFSSAFGSLERDAALLIVAVAGDHVATVHPRKDQLEAFFEQQSDATQLDTRNLQKNLLEGVSELVQQAANDTSDSQGTFSSSMAAMTSAFSIALCLINRFLVATNAGVSALHDEHAWRRGNADDEGVVSAIGGSTTTTSRKAQGWSPRVLMVQASDDRPGDYNAIMNCAFASVKHQIVVDGCFLQSTYGSKSSTFLEQTCDLTGGLFLPLSGAAQANKALAEVLLSVFLPPRSCRSRMNLLAINKVDFRARSFDTHKIVDTAFVCNQCLSIFEHKPQDTCPTCDAEIRTRKGQRS